MSLSSKKTRRTERENIRRLIEKETLEPLSLTPEEKLTLWQHRAWKQINQTKQTQ
jgi:hypothetical protein